MLKENVPIRGSYTHMCALLSAYRNCNRNPFLQVTLPYLFDKKNTRLNLKLYETCISYFPLGCVERVNRNKTVQCYPNLNRLRLLLLLCTTAAHAQRVALDPQTKLMLQFINFLNPYDLYLIMCSCFLWTFFFQRSF